MTTRTPPLHEIIANRREEIVRKYVELVRQHGLAPRGASAAEITHRLRPFLDEIVRELRAGDGDVTEDADARHHGSQRWLLGLDLHGLIREYGLLREVLFSEVKSAGATLGIDEWNTLSRRLTFALAEACTEHTRRHEEDVAARHRLEGAHRLLAEAAPVLAASLDYRETLRKVVELVVPRMADWCVLELLPEGAERVETVATAHRDPALDGALRRTRELHPPDVHARRGIYDALSSGEPVLYDEIPEESDPRLDPALGERLRPYRPFGLRSSMIVPLRAQGATIGVLSFVTGASGRRYDPVDVEIAQDLAVSVALAIQNALLLARTQQAVRAREEAVATVSHDLRSPLSVVLSNAKLLRRATADGAQAIDRAFVDRLAATVERTALRMARLITDLLDLSRFEAGAAALKRRPERPTHLLDLAIEHDQAIADERGVRLAREVGCDAPVHCDPERVLQVLGNLVGNAIKFSPPGAAVTLGTSAASGECRFFVRDEGPGIPEEQVKHLFDRYWQAPGAAKSGSGLGLAIAREITSAHGGRIWVESREGAGTTFWFTIPAAKPA